MKIYGYRTVIHGKAKLRSHEKALKVNLFVNSVKVYYDQRKVSQNMEESMTIFAGNVLSFTNIYKMPTEL